MAPGNFLGTGSMNIQKIRRAAAFTNKLWASVQKAQDCLRTFNVNLFGVLVDQALLRNDLVTAKAAIEAALHELDGFKDWPAPKDYK